MRKKRRLQLNEDEQAIYNKTRDTILAKRESLYAMGEKSKAYQKARRQYKRYATAEAFKMNLAFVKLNKMRGLKLFAVQYPKFLMDMYVKPNKRKLGLWIENALFIVYNLCALLGIVTLVLLMLNRIAFNF